MLKKQRGVFLSVNLLLIVVFCAESQPTLSFRNPDSKIGGRRNLNRNFYISADGDYETDREIRSCSMNNGQIFNREISTDGDHRVVRITKKTALQLPIKKSIHYPVFKKFFYPVKVPKLQPYPVEKKLPYPVKVYVKVPVKIPKPVKIVKEVPYPVKVPFERPVPVKIFIPRPYPVEKIVHYEVEVPVPQPFPIEKEIPVPVRVHEYVAQPYPVEVETEKEIGTEIDQQKFQDHQEENGNPIPIIEYPKNRQPWLAEELGYNYPEKLNSK